MKNNRVIALLNEDKTEMKSMLINGKKYNMGKNETYPEFYQRLKKEVGYDFLEGTEIITQSLKSYNNRNRKKAAAIAVAGVMGLTGMTYGLTACKANDTKNKAEQSQEYNSLIANETNPELKAIYEKLLKYNDGEELVKELQLIDRLQSDINEIAIANPDGKGKVSYVLAEELAAIHDVYNANLDEKTILESEEIGRCYYFSGQANLINLSQGARDVQEIESLIDESNVKTYQEKMQTETQKALDNYNIAPKSFKNLAKEIYGSRNSNPESQMEMAFGQPGIALALNNGLTGKELKNYQEASKTEGTQANRLFKEAYSETKSFAIAKGETSIKKQSLINDALEIMDEKNHVNEYDNTGYDPSTTKKGKEMIKAIIGDLAIDGNGGYWIINQKTTTTHKRTPITKEEAINKFGKDKVKKAEQEAEANTKVDTDGDGKVDKPIPEANKDEQERAEQEVASYEKSYSAGQNDYINGRGYNPSGYNSSAYAAGWNNAKNVYEEQKDKQPTKPTQPATQPATQPTTQPTTEVKQVKRVETNNEVIDLEETSYKNSNARVRA